MPRRYYVTTPIYYINDVPHLGSAYTTIAADVMARYHRLRGDDTWFLTGTDEHGLKIQRVAEERGIDPHAYAAELAATFETTWPKLGIAPDDFIRTSSERHKKGAQAIWKRIADNGDIYLGHYEGLYCVGCEAYYTEKDLDQPGNVCKIHKKTVETMKEETYFFRLKKYAEPLLAFYAAHPEFVQPAGRFNEVKSFVASGLEDISVSRTTFKWGVPVPGDDRHIMYVWFDALANYFTALGEPVDRGAFWAEAHHLVGKDILRFHAVYWPAFLLAAKLPVPQQVFAHGFLTYNGEKMSKTLRNTISPVALAEAISPTIGADTLRYCLMRAIAFGADGDFGIKDVLQRYQSELGNTLGNLLNRIFPFADAVPEKGAPGPLEEALLAAYPASAAAVAKAFDETDPTAALTALFELCGRVNEYVDKAAPWTARKNGDAARLGTIVATLVEVLGAVSVMIAPVMPVVAAKMREQLGLPALAPAVDRDAWPFALPTRKAGEPLKKGEPIFPRFDKDKEAAILAAFVIGAPAATEAAPAAAAEAPLREAKATIQYDDFAKIDLRVGVVLSAERVKKKDKLLDLRVDTGDAAPRRIVAGIALSYAPEAIVGMRIVVLCNLAPRDFGKGLVSEGMLLAANDGSRLTIVTPGPDLPPGASVK